MTKFFTNSSDGESCAKLLKEQGKDDRQAPNLLSKGDKKSPCTI
jgi:hypothetical protein